MATNATIYLDPHDDVEYVNSRWPVDSGKGSEKSMSLRRPSLNNNTPANWYLSGPKNPVSYLYVGTPGFANTCAPE